MCIRIKFKSMFVISCHRSTGQSDKILLVRFTYSIRVAKLVILWYSEWLLISCFGQCINFTIMIVLKLIRAYLHAVGELIDDIFTTLLLFGSGKHHMVSVQYHYHLMHMFLGLGGIDKKQIPPDDPVQVKGEVTATQLAQGNGIVHLLHQTVHHPQGILHAATDKWVNLGGTCAATNTPKKGIIDKLHCFTSLTIILLWYQLCSRKTWS